MADLTHIDVVPVETLHRRLGFATPLAYPASSREKSFLDWKMETDDAPILRYLYRHARPSRHLEFGTWEGTGTCYCLEESDARVWTINLAQGERSGGHAVYYSSPDEVPPDAVPVREGDGVRVYQTDAGVFVGHRYRAAGYGPRVTQILCDSRQWDETAYGPEFFDTALVDGGHTEDVVLSDTRKALEVVRQGGLILWHDFCPDPQVFQTPATVGVVGALTRHWHEVGSRLKDAFWIQPSYLLVGVR